MFESTTYAGHSYGSRKRDVTDILSQGKHVLTVMDICGAMALKTHFPNVIIIYIKRDKRSLIESLLKKNLSIDEKVSRFLALESETKNAEICDYTVRVETYDLAAKEILTGLGIKK